jgi:hypothetical protein
MQGRTEKWSVLHGDSYIARGKLSGDFKWRANAA